MARVIVFSPSPYSRYTIGVVELLHRRGIEVSAIAVVRLLNPSRLRGEFSRDGRRLLKKIWTKLVLRHRAPALGPAVPRTMRAYMAELGIRDDSVWELRKRLGIPVVSCTTLNDPAVVDALRTARPDLVVFTGGGLLRAEVLAAAGAGVVNCHMGILPPYRGMDVVEWPLLHDDYDRIGLTLHFMAEGVDTGDILRVVPVPLVPNDCVAAVRARMEPLMCEEMVETVAAFLAGRLARAPQRLEDGRQYFIMHPRLAAIADAKLRARTASAPLSQAGP